MSRHISCPMSQWLSQGTLTCPTMTHVWQCVNRPGQKCPDTYNVQCHKWLNQGTLTCPTMTHVWQCVNRPGQKCPDTSMSQMTHAQKGVNDLWHKCPDHIISTSQWTCQKSPTCVPNDSYLESFRGLINRSKCICPYDHNSTSNHKRFQCPNFRTYTYLTIVNNKTKIQFESCMYN